MVWAANMPLAEWRALARQHWRCRAQMPTGASPRAASVRRGVVAHRRRQAREHRGAAHRSTARTRAQTMTIAAGSASRGRVRLFCWSVGTVESATSVPCAARGGGLASVRCAGSRSRPSYVWRGPSRRSMGRWSYKSMPPSHDQRPLLAPPAERQMPRTALPHLLSAVHSLSRRWRALCCSLLALWPSRQCRSCWPSRQCCLARASLSRASYALSLT